MKKRRVTSEPRLFNNCHRRDHIKHFGKDAFFDLDREGSQSLLATDLKKGEKCIVATQNKQRDSVEFVWFLFDRETNDPNEEGYPVRVQRGKQLRSERMKKSRAAKAPIYRAFFNRNGHFRRGSVIEPKD